MSFTLFPDQVKFIDDVQRTAAAHKRVICCAATGFGKSKVFITITQRAIARGKTVLILTESKKIFRQISDECVAKLINPESEHLFLPVNNIYIAMAQTLVKRQELIDQLIALGDDLICIIDEAHIGTFNKILDQLKANAYFLGFTATPDARWAKHLPIYYNAIVVGPQPHELVLSGRLCGYRHFARVSADLDKLVLQRGEFTEESQEQVFGDKKVYDDLYNDLRETPYKKCLIFCASIKDAEDCNARLNANGFPSVCVHKSMKPKDGIKDKEKLFEMELIKFTHGVIKICVSVGTMTKGFDYPPINLIVLKRATTSLPTYLQMPGRASRVLSNEIRTPIHEREKQTFTVLDYGSNFTRHGLWDFERDWASLWAKPKKAKDSVAPIKMCPECQYISPTSVKECPNCGHKYEKKDVSVEVGQLIEVTEMYTAMVGREIASLSAKELSIYAKLKNKTNFAARIARSIDKDREGYLEQFRLAMGYKSGWVDYQRKLQSDKDVGFTNFVLTA